MHVFTVFIVKLVMASTFSFSAQKVSRVPPPAPPVPTTQVLNDVPPPAPPADAALSE